MSQFTTEDQQFLDEELAKQAKRDQQSPTDDSKLRDLRLGDELVTPYATSSSHRACVGRIADAVIELRGVTPIQDEELRRLFVAADEALARLFEKLLPERACRVCGCTDEHACQGGCSWVEADLCSSCAAVPSTP